MNDQPEQPNIESRVVAAIVARAKELGLTQADLARMTGISTNQINRYFLGIQPPRMENVDKLLVMLDLVVVPRDSVP